LGYELDRQKGSHAIYKNSSGKRVIVAIHSGKDLKPGTLAGMIKDIGLEKEKFFQLLSEL
jgi:predicted RNA binding protein YcfA (HicA-like mRNA interferase family)